MLPELSAAIVEQVPSSIASPLKKLTLADRRTETLPDLEHPTLLRELYVPIRAGSISRR